MLSWAGFSCDRKSACAIPRILERLGFMPKSKMNYPTACCTVSKKVYESFPKVVTPNVLNRRGQFQFRL
jgi:hypothetical protein